MAALTIGKAARSAGIGVETIRFYERKGLIRQPPRPTAGGPRDYGGGTLQRLRFIAGAKRLGFSLAETAGLLALLEAPGASCRDVQAQAKAKRGEVQAKIEGLTRIRDSLDRLLGACPGKGSLADCAILEAIESAENSGGTS
ncbi:MULTISPECIES: MerR family DNA-binding protein [Leisingera]|uniref:MerR family DNA-binding protein n=1 Tax=Leisingera TaxID=191028 RepID=UPI000409A437|nr:MULTISPECIES: MerR family DNA-binding protein [Leisingera]